jgi:hypothetical protein
VASFNARPPANCLIGHGAIASFRKYAVDRMIDDIDDQITLKEGVADVVQKHPYMTAMVAGYFLSKALKKTTPAATLDVLTQKMKFFAKNSVERKLQKAIVTTLLDSGHYALISAKAENGTFVWTIRRTGR